MPHGGEPETSWPVPDSLSDLSSDVRRRLGDHPAAELFAQCFTNTWTTTMSWSAHGEREVFVSTGDIPAMWLRDSTAQVRPYLAAADDQVVADAIAGVSRRQVRCVLTDPYANAFNDGPTGSGHTGDRPAPGPWVWERKYEIDSLAAVIQLAFGLWRATGRTDHLGPDFARAARVIVDLWRLEQDHDRSSYTFVRDERDTLPGDGRGGPVGFTGMTWSAFRPSDDRCEHHYLVPSNALASVSLHGLAELAREVLGDDQLATDSEQLAAELDDGIVARGIDGDVLAYEVDGLGHKLVADDANLPSLLSLPFIGWCTPHDPLYAATRATVLSERNPWYFAGRHAAGIGSPHTWPGYIWPLAIATTGLTATGEQEAAAALWLLAETTGGTGLMHESFDVDDPGKFTRAWFGWANAMFAELALAVTGTRLGDLFPRGPRADR
jgi:meiotically up-regulated gene 157 (Mug157) protein